MIEKIKHYILLILAILGIMFIGIIFFKLAIAYISTHLTTQCHLDCLSECLPHIINETMT